MAMGPSGNCSPDATSCTCVPQTEVEGAEDSARGQLWGRGAEEGRCAVNRAPGNELHRLLRGQRCPEPGPLAFLATAFDEGVRERQGLDTFGGDLESETVAPAARKPGLRNHRHQMSDLTRRL